MLQGKINAALKVISEDSGDGVHSVSEEIMADLRKISTISPELRLSLAYQLDPVVLALQYWGTLLKKSRVPNFSKNDCISCSDHGVTET